LERGGGTEFYKHDDPVAIAREFFAFAGVRVLEELTDDSLFPYPSRHDSEAVLRAEDAKRSEAKEKALKDKPAVATLKRASSPSMDTPRSVAFRKRYGTAGPKFPVAKGV